MIAKGKAIAHGANAVGYAMHKENMGSFVATNLLDSRQPGEIIKEFEMVNRDNERCKNKYLRFEIGIAPDDEKKMSGEMLRAITREFAAKMGLKNHQ